MISQGWCLFQHYAGLISRNWLHFKQSVSFQAILENVSGTETLRCVRVQHNRSKLKTIIQDLQLLLGKLANRVDALLLGHLAYLEDVLVLIG